MKFNLIVFFAVIFLLIPLVCFAATYYVDGGMANDLGSGQSWGTAKKYIYSGISLMSGGDTLWIKNGVYTGTNNRIYNIKSGTANAYTKIYAESDFGVTLEDTGTGDYSSPVDFRDSAYVEFRGFNVKDHSARLKINVRACNHIKVIRCSCDGVHDYSPNGHFTAGTGSSYILFEECFAYGIGRYPFGAGGDNTHDVIFRRCVMRFDANDNPEPCASFSTYTTPYVYFQNCIAIDGRDIRSMDVASYPKGAYKGLRGFYSVKMSQDVGIYGCIVLHQDGGGYFMEHQPIQNCVVQDSVAWDLKSVADSAYLAWPLFVGYYENPAASATLNRLTLGISDINANHGIIQSNILQNATFTNNIIYGLSQVPSDSYAVSGFEDLGSISDYNCYYGNAGNRDSRYGVGLHSLAAANGNAINPLTSGLKHLTKIESGSMLSRAGVNGGQIGASILYRYGRDSDGDGICGLLTDDDGWNELTGVSLWPFPNEDIIRADCKAYYKAAGSMVVSSFAACTFDASIDTISAPGHGLSENDPVTFKAISFPGGISANRRYFAKDVTANTFKIINWRAATTERIDITSNGSNVTYAKGWDNPELNGDRGFCVDGQTLTKYIWEYLENPTPAEYATSSNNDQSGGGGGSCFIATEVFGTYSNPEVMVLRRFRDEKLLSNIWGREFVEFYYTHSPKVAFYIRSHPSAKVLMRYFLQSLVKVLDR